MGHGAIWAYEVDCTAIPNYDKMTIDNFIPVTTYMYVGDASGSFDSSRHAGSTSFEYNPSTGIFRYIIKNESHDIKDMAAKFILYYF